MPLSFKNYKTSILVVAILGLSSVFGFLMNLLNRNGIVVSITATTFISAILLLYDRYLWKKFPFLLTIKNISGRYKGELESHFNNKTYDIILEITQTASSIHISQFTKNETGITRSDSTSAEIQTKRNEIIELKFSYENSGDECRDELDRHLGFCALTFDRERRSLNGIYFTNRETQTKGKITAKKVDKKIRGSF